MSDPKSEPKSEPHLDTAIRDLRALVDRGPAPPSPRPVVPPAAPAPSLWGPSSPHVTSPLTMLLQVVKSAHMLEVQLEALQEAITGEHPAQRQRATVQLSQGLLPAIAQLAHEIERSQGKMFDLIQDIRGKL